ncbi:MAG TPA: endonuclease/exonuclease/phosphatase family protein [Pseudonocardiaceae bacterium]
MNPPFSIGSPALTLFDSRADSRSWTPTVPVLRLLTWNVQHASPERARRQGAWLADSDADVLVLTEVSESDGGRALAQALHESGFTTYTPTGAVQDYRVLLAARGATLEPVHGVRAPYLPHRCLAARLHAAGLSIGVMGLYVPSRGGKQGRNVAKRSFQSAVTAVLSELAEKFPSADGPLIVAGDLNVLEPGHQPHHAVFGAWEYDFYRAFTNAELADAFRHLHPHAVQHSWHGRSGAGYRFDHIFCSRQHLPQVTDVGYLHEPRLTGLSDHSAMAATVTATGH